MTTRPPCETIPLRDLLNDDCELEHQIQIEQHLESCESCRSRLSSLAADEDLWTQAASHLSTIDEIELPSRLTSRMNASSSMLIPMIDSDATSEHLPAGAFEGDSDWKRILDPPTHPEMLGRIDHFEVESKIGQGGMGIVLKGFDRELNRAVAIKVLAPHLASNGTARKRFAREAQAAAAVMHPNVVPIYSVNQSSRRPYIVMQLVPGHSLESLVHENGPLRPKDVVRISLQVASGLAAAHEIGLIHRDVKPGNVLVERDVTRVMITDFGLARAVDDAGLTQTGWLAGTPHYMSPEQSKGDDLDPRTDLFSLGSLMYYLATGREPFRGDKPYAVIQKIIHQRHTDPMDVNGEIPWMLADIIEKLLEKEPKKRFQSANELVLVLQQYLAHLQHPTQAKPPRKILTERRKRRRVWVGAGLMAAVVLAAGAWFFLPTVGSMIGQTDSSDVALDPDPESTTSPMLIGSPHEIGQTELSNIVPDPESDAGPMLIDSQPEIPVPPIAAPLRFSFDDDDVSLQIFLVQLDSIAKEMDAFDRQLHDTVPIDFDVTPPSPFPGRTLGDNSNWTSVETMLRSLESHMESDTVARDLKTLSIQDRRSPARHEPPVTELPLALPKNEPQPPSKGKNDED